MIYNLAPVQALLKTTPSKEADLQEAVKRQLEHHGVIAKSPTSQPQPTEETEEP